MAKLGKPSSSLYLHPSLLSQSDRGSTVVAGWWLTLVLQLHAYLHTQSYLFNFKVSQVHTHKQSHIFFNTHTHNCPHCPNPQTYKVTFCYPHTHREPSFICRQYPSPSFPAVIVWSKFKGLINRFYIVNMTDAVQYTVSSTHKSRLSIQQ